MPVSWRIAGRYVLVDSTDAPTLRDWKDAVDAALADPGFEKGMPLVHDTRRMTRVPMPEEARERVAFLIDRSRKWGIARWAVVVSGTASYGMGRMAQFLSESSRGIEFSVFRELDEAVKWAFAEEAAKGGAA